MIDHDSQESVERDTPFFVLYYAVQAIGSQFCGNGAFEPGNGQSWQLFQTALGRLQELIGSKASLESVQVAFCLHSFTSPTNNGRPFLQW